MFVNRMLFLVPLFVLVVAAAGCRSVRRPDRPAAPSVLTQEQFVQFGDAVIAAVTSGNFQRYSELADGGSVKPATREEFMKSWQAVEEEFGAAKASGFVTTLKAPIVKNMVWKVEFQRPAKDGRPSEPVEVLCQLILGEVDGKIQLVGMRFL